MQRLLTLTLTEHDANWSDKGWSLVREIKDLGVGDDLRESAAGILLDVDASTSKTMDFQPTELIFDPSGKRLLMAKTTPEDSQDPGTWREEEVRIWDSATDELSPLPQRIHDRYGSITFRADGTPLQLV
jgi:hypothetical protein